MFKDRNSLIKGMIFDIEGTLTIDQKAIDEVAMTLEYLRAKGYQMRFVTNMTGKTPKQLSDNLKILGFYIEADEIETSVTTAIKYLDQHFKDSKGFLALPSTLQSQFSHIQQDHQSPEFVVLGDLEDEMNYALLNKIFSYLRNGAQLIAFHRNLFFMRDNEYLLDTGIYIDAFEKLLFHKTIITGKPSKEIFVTAMTSMGLKSDEVIIIGDDINTDIKGAELLGITSVLVETGKFQLTKGAIVPECVGLFIPNASMLKKYF